MRVFSVTHFLSLSLNCAVADMLPPVLGLTLQLRRTMFIRPLL